MTRKKPVEVIVLDGEVHGDGEAHKVGDRFSCSPDEAQRLMEAGVVGLPESAAAPAEDDPAEDDPAE